MRKLVLAVFILSLTVPLHAANSKHQSYISYDVGGTTVVQGEDQRRIDARVNLAIFPGDEITTSRRGRSEIRLADGNVVAIDRSTTLRFQSILNSYEGDSSQTIAVLAIGQAIVHRLSRDSSPLRLDTENASYVSSKDSIYSLESPGRGSDTLSVYEGSVEVRSPDKTTRIRSGEQVTIDREGVYSTNTVIEEGTTDFERWYLRRASNHSKRTSRYLDRSLAYADSDLDENGSWIYVSDYSSYVWRPRVSIGWRPYYYGSWHHGRGGSLVWWADEPWGWVPYHYGRWAYAPAYGWVWLPGSGYSHAWVYWAYGPSYIGWIPAGWYDCYRPYYNWYGGGYNAGFGFNGRIRFRDADLRGWTFVNPDTLVSNRVDRAALSTDRIRDRFTRDGDQGTLTNIPARFSRSELENPNAAIGAIARRGIGGGTGKESSGSLADMTPFFRRDPELSSEVRDRITRSRGTSPEGDAKTLAPGRGGSIGRGSDSPSDAPSARQGAIGRERDGGSPTIRRPIGDRPATKPIDRGEAVDRLDDAPAARGSRPDWRGGAVRSRERGQGVAEPEPAVVQSPDSEWRDRGGAISRGDQGGSAIPRGRTVGRDDREDSQNGSEAPERFRSAPRDEVDIDDDDAADVPRKVIDRIGGARVSPSVPSEDRPQTRSRPERSAPAPERSSGSGRVIRPEAPKSSPPASKPSSPPSSDKSSGKIKRDN